MKLPPAVRRAAERFSRGRILRRRLPSDLGGATIFVTPDAALRYWLPNIAMVDNGLLDAARELVQPGDVVWDVGANVGLFTFTAAHRVGDRGTVVALEPDPFLAGILMRSRTGIRNSDQVMVCTMAVAASSGLACLRIATRGRANNHLDGFGNSQTGGTRGAMWVSTTTLDDLARTMPKPTLIKIDVEGAELEVLRGGSKLLSEARPRLLMEVNDDRAVEVTQLLRDANYRLFDGSTPQHARHELERAVWNTLAIPRELANDSSPSPRAV